MKIVYGTFRNLGGSAYLFNGQWYPFSSEELLYNTARNVSCCPFLSLDDDEVQSEGLNNPPFLVRFEIPE